MKGTSRFLIVVLVLLLLLGGGLVFMRGSPEAAALFRRPDPQDTLGTETDVLKPLEGAIGSFSVPSPEGEPGTENGKGILAAFLKFRGYELLGPCRTEGKQAEQDLRITVLDVKRLGEGLTEAMTATLRERVAAAQRSAEIYENGAFRPELLQSSFDAALAAKLQEDLTPCLVQRELTLRLSYQEGAWKLDNADELAAAALYGLESAARADETAAALLNTAAAALPYLPLHYTIDENALSGPVPNQECYGETSDPAVIEALLLRPEAQALIGGQSLAWNRGLDFMPGAPMRYYLDESLLVLVWQEREPFRDWSNAYCVATYSEVFISDGSQLRRKISGDELWSFAFRTTTRYAQEANAVLAVGGDFYYHGRNCGIGIYQREMFRFEPVTCDCCYITGDGDMLFSYRGQFQTEDEVMRFVRDNDVLFSLGFGPVLIDNGADVTPESYPWGEIQDEYARSALGMLGRHHYLTANLNCGVGEYFYLVTLRQAADVMIRHGCVKAYTLDGGQTATTVFNGQLINPVQFGWEKDISDVIYFATAVPND